MKKNILVAIIATALLATGMAFAQTGQAGGRGQARGYAAPPQSQEERAARQASCLEKNGGVCPQNGGQECKGPGNGAGKGARKGLRDGTGPRAADGTCPLGKTPAKK